MSFYGSYSIPPFHCRSNYERSSQHGDGCGAPHTTTGHPPAGACDPHESCGTFHAAEHGPCGEDFWRISALSVAWHDARQIGSGVAGHIGCGDGGPCGDESTYERPLVDAGDGNLTYDTASNLAIGLANGAADSILLGTGDANTLLAGNGAGDAITLGTGDGNLLQLGQGDNDTLLLLTGNSNEMRVRDGANDSVAVSTGDHNCLTAGNGAGDNVAVDTGNANAMEAGNGKGDFLSIGTGDGNLLQAGNGAQDIILVGTGNHNTLAAGCGTGDQVQLSSGDANLLSASNGNGDAVTLGSGNHNAVIAGDGAGDQVLVASGDANVMAVGNGAGDLLRLGDGNGNIIFDGTGAGDTILVGSTIGAVGSGVNSNNDVVIGAGNGDQAWGSRGNGNVYIAGAGNDLIHTGGGNDIVFGDSHTETATPRDPFHLIGTDSLAWNWNADGGQDTFILDGAQPSGCNGLAGGLGTTVMTGGGGTEKYWLDGLWGNAVITDFNTAGGDRITIGGATGADVAELGPVQFRYVHSAYDASHSGNVDLLITFGCPSNTAQSITLIDYKAQDTAGSFNNLDIGNPASAEATLARIFDFSASDDQAVAHEIAALSAQHLILH